jgi:hypothetical protein
VYDCGFPLGLKNMWLCVFGKCGFGMVSTLSMDPHRAWFDTHLASQAAAMERVLRGFFYVEWMPAHGSTWFEDILKVYLEGELLPVSR